MRPIFQTLWVEKLFFLLMFFALPACAGEDRVMTSTENGESYCVPKKMSEDDWFKAVDFVFSGTIEKKFLRLPSQLLQSNSCWAKVHVSKIEKGKITDQTILAKIIYDAYEHNIFDIKSCPIDEGSVYRFFAMQRHNKYLPEATEYPSVFVSDNADCTPLIRLIYRRPNSPGNK